ncbi:MAG: glycosyltransferase family 4 protein [Alphaproteobacteria bacterium]|nr:glycosyltransferase family 4 protein [Alphaproteobacteria bacterium]
MHEPQPQANSRPQANAKILVLITEDWFAVSHFIPAIEALVATGAEVAVATRINAKRAQIEASGARVVSFDYSRGPIRPVMEARVAMRLRGLIARERPDAIHAISLKPIALITGLRRLVPRHVLGIHLTGVGFAGTAAEGRTGFVYQNVLKMVVGALRQPAHRGLAHLFVENPDDQARLGELGAFPDQRVTILGGAGVDPQHFADSPLPGLNPARVGFVGRMVWTKGVDLLVEAYDRLAAEGHVFKLDLCGTPDAENPRAVSQETLAQWNARANVNWRGRVEDIAKFWKNTDICVVPSRGGEGLPRALLEAAACARPIITTDVPGCRYFVRDGIEGLIVPPDNPEALTEALRRLIVDRAAARRMGMAARQRLLSGFTEDHVRTAIRDKYAELLGIAPPARPKT